MSSGGLALGIGLSPGLDADGPAAAGDDPASTPAVERLTEAGELRLTEAGDTRITE